MRNGREGGRAFACVLACVHVFVCELGDEGATHLAAALMRNTTLQHLSFYENNILDEGTVAIGRAFKTSPSLADSSITIEWHKGVDPGERPLGHYWEQPGLPPLSSAAMWPHDKVVQFFLHERRWQRGRPDRRLAVAMATHPRLGFASRVRLLDDYLVALIVQQLEADKMPILAEWQAEHAFFARFYKLYDRAADYRGDDGWAAEAGAMAEEHRMLWAQVASLETEAVAFADKVGASCALSAAPDLFEKLGHAFERLGMSDRSREMHDRSCDAAASFELSSDDSRHLLRGGGGYGSGYSPLSLLAPQGLGAHSPPGDHELLFGDGRSGNGPAQPSMHHFQDGFCSICFREEHPRMDAHAFGWWSYFFFYSEGIRAR